MTYDIKRNTEIAGNGDFALRVLSGNVSFAEALAVLGPTTLANLIVNGTLNVTGLTTLVNASVGGTLTVTGLAQFIAGLTGGLVVNDGDVTMLGAAPVLTINLAGLLRLGTVVGGAAAATLNERPWTAESTISLRNDALAFNTGSPPTPLGFTTVGILANTLNSPFAVNNTDNSIEISQDGDYLFSPAFLITGSSVAASDGYDVDIAEGPVGGPFITVANYTVRPLWTGLNNEKQGFTISRAVTVSGATRAFQMRVVRVSGTGSLFAFANESFWTVQGPF